MPKIEKLSDFEGQIRLITGRHWNDLVQREVGKGIRSAAEIIKKRVVANLTNGRAEWPPLHPFTRVIRDFRGSPSTRPLNDRGALAAAITVQTENLEALIGILPGARSSRGTIELSALARMQEKGFTIAVTPRMREFFKRRGIRLKFTTTHLFVPERPFMQPAVEESKQDVQYAIAASVAQVLASIQVDGQHFQRHYRPGARYGG